MEGMYSRRSRDSFEGLDMIFPSSSFLLLLGGGRWLHGPSLFTLRPHSRTACVWPPESRRDGWPTGAHAGAPLRRVPIRFPITANGACLA